MYILNIASAIKEMSVNEFRGFIFEHYCKGIGFIKEKSYYSMKRLKNKKKMLLLPKKLIEKIPDPSIAKEHYQSCIRGIAYQTKTFEKTNIIDVKSVIT